MLEIAKKAGVADLHRHAAEAGKNAEGAETMGRPMQAEASLRRAGAIRRGITEFELHMQRAAAVWERLHLEQPGISSLRTVLPLEITPTVTNNPVIPEQPGKPSDEIRSVRAAFRTESGAYRYRTRANAVTGAFKDDLPPIDAPQEVRQEAFGKAIDRFGGAIGTVLESVRQYEEDKDSMPESRRRLVESLYRFLEKEGYPSDLGSDTLRDIVNRRVSFSELQAKIQQRKGTQVEAPPLVEGTSVVLVDTHEPSDDIPVVNQPQPDALPETVGIELQVSEDEPTTEDHHPEGFQAIAEPEADQPAAEPEPSTEIPEALAAPVEDEQEQPTERVYLKHKPRLQERGIGILRVMLEPLEDKSGFRYKDRKEKAAVRAAYSDMEDVDIRIHSLSGAFYQALNGNKRLTEFALGEEDPAYDEAFDLIRQMYPDIYGGVSNRDMAMMALREIPYLSLEASETPPPVLPIGETVYPAPEPTTDTAPDGISQDNGDQAPLEYFSTGELAIVASQLLDLPTIRRDLTKDEIAGLERIVAGNGHIPTPDAARRASRGVFNFLEDAEAAIHQPYNAENRLVLGAIYGLGERERGVLRKSIKRLKQST